jgi:hypothetical protein
LEPVCNGNKLLTYERFTDDEKYSIFNLSVRYLVRFIENSNGLQLYLYTKPRTFIEEKHKKLCVKPTISVKKYITYDSDFEEADVRLLTIPYMKYLSYECQCVDHCSCKYVNLPTISKFITGTINISNNGSAFMELDNEQYKKYLKISPAYLYQHRYIMNKDLDIDYAKYLWSILIN